MDFNEVYQTFTSRERNSLSYKIPAQSFEYATESEVSNYLIDTMEFIFVLILVFLGKQFQGFLLEYMLKISNREQSTAFVTMTVINCS